MHTGTKKPTSLRWMIIALIMCLVSGIGVATVQTSGGHTKVEPMSWVSADGHKVSGNLYIPSNATTKTPAPAVVTTHGWYNSKEMQDPFFVELSRRGFVVLTLDLRSHGNSANLDGDHLYDDAVGVDDAVVQLSTMKFVDQKRIGITGHSSGGSATNMELNIDSKRKTPLVAASLLQGNDWNDDFANDHHVYKGAHSFGIIADKYDDFNFWEYDKSGNVTSIPRDFIKTDMAKTILNFGEKPYTFKGKPEAGKYYSKSIDGKDVYRVIYTPSISHAMVPFSTTASKQAVEFFDKALGAPKSIGASNQVWPVKTIFNVIGLAGFFIFMVSLTLTLARTKRFASVTAGHMVEPQPKPRPAGAVWFWGGLAVSAIFSAVSFLFAYKTITNADTPSFFPQTPPLVIGTWAAASGVFAIVLMIVTYYAYSKRNGLSMRDVGATISVKSLLMTIVLAIVVAVLTYSLVFLSEYFFHSDYRIWLLSVKTFDSNMIGVAARYLPFFLIYFVANSVAVNCFNYLKIAKRDWVNTFFVALSANLGPLVLVVLHYWKFFATGTPMFTDYKSGMIWIIPVVVILFGAAIVSRIIYRRTRNPYLPGIVNALIVTMLTCATSATIWS